MVQVVIDIPDDVYDECKGDVYFPDTGGILWDAVRDGTPIPKGHGRLIDADDLDLKRIDIILSGEVKDTVDALSKMGMLIIIAPTVIEADSGKDERGG